MAKTLKIWRDLRQALTLTANISGAARNIKNWKQTWSTQHAFSKKMANLGPL